MAVVSLVTKPPAENTDVAPEGLQSKRLAALLLEVARCMDKDVAAVLPSRLDADPRLEALRSVLIEQERAALARLQQKIDDPQQFAEAISAVLAAAIELSGKRDE